MAQFRLHGRTATIYYNMNKGPSITIMKFENPKKWRRGAWSTKSWRRTLLQNNGLAP